MAELNTVMLVEDEQDIRQIVSMSLEMVGNLKVHACSSGKDALLEVGDANPDIILLDVMMPEMDGPSTLKELRKLPDFSQTPIAFLTAKVQPEEVAGYLALGAVGVIEKPFDPMTLADQVRALWQKSQ